MCLFMFFIFLFFFFFFFFFFQAEDGIRDLTVTGVQTCALPIWDQAGFPHRRGSSDRAARLRSFPGSGGTTFIGRSANAPRSEERRVGKECRSRWSPYH